MNSLVNSLSNENLVMFAVRNEVIAIIFENICLSLILALRINSQMNSLGKGQISNWHKNRQMYIYEGEGLEVGHY